MRVISTLLFVVIFIATSAQKDVVLKTKSSSFDTIKLDNVSFMSYKNWKPIISRQYKEDSSTLDLDFELSRGFHPVFSRSSKGVVYEVINKNNKAEGNQYFSPLFMVFLENKDDFASFFSNAPKNGFNPLKQISTDTASISIFYYRQSSENESTAKFKNIQFIANEVLDEVYNQYDIETSLSKLTNKELGAKNQEKIKSLYTDYILYNDFVVSPDGSNCRITGSFRYNEDKNESILDLFSVTTYKEASFYLSIVYNITAKINRQLTLTAEERKNWFNYFLPIIKNVYNEQIVVAQKK